MSGVIYLVHGEGKLVPMREESYDSEDVLQRLLADYPDLLGGEQMNASTPRRWLLLAREAGLPSEEAGGDRWSIDHLFVDQDGIPTIIEVKRSTDSRIRREVVGQMLDYAANAVVYWPVERLRTRFEALCESEERDPETAIQESLGVDSDPDEFWKLVQTNLQAGRVRLVFVADVIPPELRRVVEFLNQQMNPAEVLAVEVRQYVGQGQQALVPRVIGQTQQAVGQKSVGGTGTATKHWDESSFLAALQLKAGSRAAAVGTRLLAWSHANASRIWWGQGSFYPMVDLNGQQHWLFSARTNGRITIEFANIRKSAAFADVGDRREILRRLNELNGVEIPEDRIDLYPSIPMEVLGTESDTSKFLSVFEWMISELRRR
jgi:hypothetical protein